MSSVGRDGVDRLAFFRVVSAKRVACGEFPSILIFLKRFLSGAAVPKMGLGLKLIVPFSDFVSPISLLIGRKSQMHCVARVLGYALPSAQSRNA